MDGVKSFNMSFQGTSHIKKNKECQDASASYFDENMAIAIVCDGHGGDDYIRSSIGSSIACDVTEKIIKNFLENIKGEKFFSTPEVHLKKIEDCIIYDWNTSIYKHFENNPFLEDELNTISSKAKKKYMEGRIESAYGTTLIAVAMTAEYCFGIHIGDGKCVSLMANEKFCQPIPWDEKCFLNATTSICDADASLEFRHFYSKESPTAIFVGSDGIDDCFINDNQLYDLYKTIIFSFGTSDFEKAVDELKDYLPRLSSKGSGDDVSIAAILDLEKISHLSLLKEFEEKIEKKNNGADKIILENIETIKICNYCGKKNEIQANFCSFCGKSLSDFPLSREIGQKTEEANENSFSSDTISELLDLLEKKEDTVDKNLDVCYKIEE